MKYILLSVILCNSIPVSYSVSNCSDTVTGSFITPSEILQYFLVDVTCSAANVQIRLDECSIRLMGLNATTDIGIGDTTSSVFYASNVTDNSCMGVILPGRISDHQDIVFTLNLAACSATITFNSTHTTYAHAVRNFDDPTTTGSVTRDIPLYVEFSCVYDMALEMSVFFQADTGCLDTPHLQYASAQQVLQYLNVQVICSSYEIEVRIDECAIRQLGFNATTEVAVGNMVVNTLYTVNVTEPTCRGSLLPGRRSNHNDLFFLFNLTLCGMETILNSSHIFYTHAVRSLGDLSSGVMQRRMPLFIQFTCGYQLTMDKSLQYTINAVSTRYTAEMVTQSGDFGVLLAAFTDNTFLTPVTTSPGSAMITQVPDYLYIGITLENTEETYLILQAQSCWATPSSSPTDTTRYSILNTGCPNTNAEALGIVILYKNYYHTIVQFAFRTFTWAGIAAANQRIYVHCQISICDVLQFFGCIYKPCVGVAEASPQQRRKRSIHDYMPITKVISLGPVELSVKKTKCGANNGGCSDFCSITPTGKRLCLCRENRHLSTDSKTCKDIRGKTNDVDFENSKQGSVSTAEAEELSEIDISWTLVVLLCICSIAIFVIMYKRNQSSRRKEKGRFNL